jgi:hypothetical protein
VYVSCITCNTSSDRFAAQDIRSLAPFFSGSLRTSSPSVVLGRQLTSFIAHLHHPAVREWAESLLEERRELWKARGLGEEEQRGIEGVRVGGKVDAVKADTNGV